MPALLAELSVDVFGVVFGVEALLLPLVEGGLNERVTSSPLANAVVLLEDHLRLVGKATLTLRFRIFVEHAWHNVHQCLTFVVLLLHDPVPALIAILWVRHEWIRAPTTLVETIVRKSEVALADRLWAFLEACATPIAVLLATEILTSRTKLTEAISVAVVAIRTLRAVSPSEVRMALAAVFAGFSVPTLQCSLDVTVARTRANLEVKRVG